MVSSSDNDIDVGREGLVVCGLRKRRRQRGGAAAKGGPDVEAQPAGAAAGAGAPGRPYFDCTLAPNPAQTLTTVVTEGIVLSKFSISLNP